MAMFINTDCCTVCGDCKPTCPTRSVLRINGAFSIDAATCNECDGDPQCMSVCPCDAIEPL